MAQLNFDLITTSAKNISIQNDTIKSNNTKLEAALAELEHSWNDTTTSANARKYAEKVAATTENLKKMSAEFDKLPVLLNDFVKRMQETGKDSGGAA